MSNVDQKKQDFADGVKRTIEEAEILRGDAPNLFVGKRGPQRVKRLVEEGKKEQEG